MIGAVHTYHDGTKHHFHRFARSLGYLDWASQPNPFRSFEGAPEFPLHPRPDAAGSAFHNSPSAPSEPQAAIRRPQFALVLGHVLRHSLGLSAWKQFRESRWSLRVNPSSGNLHPTEAYVVTASVPGGTAAVHHYAADRHTLEQRCAFDPEAWSAATGGGENWLLALTSIHWREAWKYGERAFRYCQHDLGHAIAAVRISAEIAGCRARLLPDWSHSDIAALTGIDRDEDYADAEREEPGCILIVTSHQSSVGSGQSSDGGGQSSVGSGQSSVGSGQSSVGSGQSSVGSGQSSVRSRQSSAGGQPSSVGRHEALLEAVRGGQWTGRANQLSEDHVQWTFIDDIAAATRDLGRTVDNSFTNSPIRQPTNYSAPLILKRRSAVSFDGRGSIDAAQCFAMLSAVMPHAGSPWDALWWEARIHCVLFLHRVNGLDPGVYLLARHRPVLDRLRAACGREFLWEPVHGSLPLFALARGDCRALAQRVSCDQAVAGEGFFSLGMIADFDDSLQAFGPAFYRHLFWESGVVGQVLYLEAEAAGARATGIGCFFDDPVHDVLGLTGHAFQSLYHFTIGMPVEDTRLSTEPGYAWEGGT